MPNTTKIGSIVKTTTTTTTFLPTSITGCKLWLDGADPTTIVFSSGSNINQWNDKSGNGVNVTQPTTASQPSYTAASNSVLFSYTTSMLMGNTSYYNTLCGSPFTMFFVHKKLQGHAWLLSPGNYIVTFTGTLRFTTAAVTDLDYTTPNFTTVDAEPLRIFTVQWTGTERNVRMNGQLTAYNMNNNGSTSWTNAPVVDSTWAMGGAGSSSAGNTQNMYEVLFYNSALSTTNRQTVESYLAQKWNLTSNLPATHPGLTTTLYGTSIVPVPITTTTTVTYSPTGISGCRLWLDAADVTTITQSGGTVSQWNDKSGNGYNFTQATTSNQPTFVSSGTNGLSLLRFNGTNQYLGGGTTLNIGTSDVAMFAVCKYTVGSIVESYVFAKSLYGGAAGRILFGLRTMGIADAGANVWWQGSSYESSYASYHSAEFVTARASGTNTFYANGTQFAQISPGVDTSTNWTSGYNMIVGGYNNGSGNISPPQAGLYMNGDICEILIYAATITTTQRQTIEAYLAQKWGLTASLPAGHPGLTSLIHGSTTVALPRQKIYMISKAVTASFLPTSIAGCSLWLDGADTTTLTFSSGSNVSKWKDKSASVNDFNLTSGTVSYMNDGAFSTLRFPSGAIMTSANTITWTTSSAFFIVSKVTDTTYFSYLLGFSSISSGDYGIKFLYGILTGTPGSAQYAGEFGSSNFYVNGNFNPNYGSNYYTNVYAVIDITAPTSGGTSAITLSSSFYSRYFVGSIAEFIFYPAGITSTQRQQVEGYLAQKWGLTASLPAGHPGLTTTLYGTTLVPTTANYSLSPTSITGCLLWLDGADPAATGTAPSNGATVSTWVDKSGTGNTVSASSSQPIYTRNVQNGLGVVTYNGTQDLSCTVTAGNLVGDTLNMSIYVVFSMDGSSYSHCPFCWVNGSVPRIACTGSEGGTTEIDVGSSSFRTSFSSPALSLTNQIYMLSYWKAGANTQLNLNGTSVATSSAQTTTPFASTSGVFHVGNGFNSSTYWIKGNVAEIIFFNSNLSTSTNFAKVEGYLAQKWGLTASLPAGHIGLTTTLYGTVTLPKQKITASSMTNYTLITLSSTATTFSYTGADQTFTAPANVYAVVAYIWGAGGGSGGSGQPGGAGAFAQVIVPVTPGQAYTIIVGQGGITSSTATYGGGGLGSIGNARAGGGRSAIRYSSVDIVTLGAGGGAGQDSGSTGGMANWSPLVNSGAGYPSTAAQNAAIVSGKGGTQTAGGAGGAAMGGLGVQYNGGAGGLNYGGSGGVSPAPTGGGGSGYYGGGGGGGGPYYCTGGGGGSSLLNNVIPITGGNSPNSQDQAPGTGSLYYTGSIATGGTSVGGGNGLVVLTYATASSQIKGLLMSRSSTTITMTWSASSYATSYYWALYYNTTNTSTGGVLSSYGTTSSATATATIATGGYYYFAVSGLNASGGVSQIAFSTPLLVPQLFSVTSGLLAFFSFDNTITDFQNTITLAVTGSVSYVAGRTTNQAIYLANEANSAASTFAANYLTSSYNLTVPFSVSVWFKPTNTNQGSLLSTYNSTAITSYSVNLYISGGSMSAAYNNIQNVGASVGVSVGTWYHAVITVNSSNGLTLFVNGSQVGSTITQTPSINGLMIGSIKDGGASYAFSGYLDDYRIYSRVLTGTEISAIYAGTG